MSEKEKIVKQEEVSASGFLHIMGQQQELLENMVKVDDIIYRQIEALRAQVAILEMKIDTLSEKFS